VIDLPDLTLDKKAQGKFYIVVPWCHWCGETACTCFMKKSNGGRNRYDSPDYGNFLISIAVLLFVRGV
jgi:hypothetical protein